MKRALLLAVSTCGAVHAGALHDLPSLGETRASHTATLLADGRVLVAGGFRKGPDGYSQIYTATTEIYDGAAFRPGPRLREPRAGHSATLLADGTVLVAGGWNETGMLASAELYDPRRGAFVAAASLGRPRGGGTATRLRDGRVLFTGGGDATGTASAEIYDPAGGRFVATGSMGTPRVAHTATLLPDGRVLIAGGARARGEVLAGAEIYDPAPGKFAATGSLGTARYKHFAAALADGRVLVGGGSDARDWRGQLASAEIYDPRSGTFGATGDLRAARFKLAGAAVLLPDGRVLVAGGSATVETFAGGRFDVAAEMDEAPHFGTVTVLADGGALIVGGYDDRLRASARARIYRE